MNQNIAKIDELVNSVADFSQTTIKHVEYYRDQLSVPVTDVISAWSALKKELGCLQPVSEIKHIRLRRYNFRRYSKKQNKTNKIMFYDVAFEIYALLN